jgi:hypothetical protein
MSLTPTPSSSLPNLGSQALSDAQLEQEVRAWFSALWDVMDTEESPIPAPISSMDTLQLWLQDKPGCYGSAEPCTTEGSVILVID